MKSYLHFIFLIFLIGGLLAASTASLAQITGPGSQTQNSSYNYNCFNDGYYLFTTPVWTITPSSAGTVQSVTVLSDHYTSRANIQWNQAGPATITCTYGTSFTETKNVTVICAAFPSAPTIYVVSTPICTTSGQATLDGVPGTNGDNVKWYSALTGGTLLSTGLVYTTPTISGPTSYYISSTSSGGYCESASRYKVTVKPGPAVSVPSAKVDASRCDAGSVTLSATPVSPATSIRWYTSDTNGDAVASGTSFSPNLTQSGDYYYYAASFDTGSWCSSATRLAVKATMNDVPTDLLYQASTVFGSGNVVLQAEPVTVKKWAATSLTDTLTYQVRWFADQAKANANTPVLSKGLIYTTPPIGTTTAYYARLQNKTTGCLGPVSKAMAYIYPSLITLNSVKTEIVRVEGKKAETDLATLTAAQKSVSIVYIDGLGRVGQQVAVKASPDGKDLIQPVEYDAFGRLTKQYLPYVSDTSTTGWFHSGYGAEQYNFYQVNSNKIANDAYPFAKTVYEPSPLGRVVEQTKVGQAFQPGSGHTGSVVYGLNTGSTSSEAEEVRKFNPDGTSSGFYAANILTRTEGINPDGIHTITFTDPAGRIIVIKQQLDETVEGVSVSYLETYYIYDDFGQVKFMIQPKGVAALKANGWTLTMSIKKQYVFQYVYDKRGRVTETRVPGKGWCYSVYDQLNRPVLTQDTLLKITNKWMYMKYDRAGRVVMTGLFTDNTNTTRSYFQTHLDNKNYSTEKYFEKRDVTGAHQYTNAAFPTANIEVLSVAYYDTYDFDSYTTYTAQGISGEGTQGSSIGKSTGSKTLVHGTANWLKKFVYYDKYGRPIQVRSNNHLNLTPDNLSTTVYDFEKAVKTKTYHNAGTPGNTTVINTYEYYDQGRLKGIKQSNNGSADQLVVMYEYNRLGQVVDKKLHETGSAGTGTFLQSVDYRYTINGQLASINNATLDANGTANDDTNDFFGMELLYNAAESGFTVANRYDGMVSALKWKSVGAVAGTTGQRGYAYSYDKSGKLETASYAVKGTSAWDQETGAQNEEITYDRNGNIKSLTRKQRKHQLIGITGSYTNETIDNLTYDYKSGNANSLEKVTDAASTSAAAGFDNGASTGNDYTYDYNGNLLSDANKGITSIVYNFMGKPIQVNFTGGKKLEYVYDAGGNKLTQRLYQTTTLLATTDYVNGFVYENSVLSFFGSPEGRVVKNGSNLEYQYSIADHQGNTRVVFSSVASAVTAMANFENSTNTDFPNYANVVRSSLPLFNHTTPSGTYSQKLTGAGGSQVGVTKTLKVYPGDKVKIDAYAKYYNPSGTSSNITGFALALTGAFGVTSSSTGEALKAYNTLNNYGGIIAGGGSGGSSSYPKLFVNILLFDKDYNFLDAAWEQIDGGEQIGATPTNHDLMSKEVTVKEAGYAYVFVSNENPTLVEFYVDDVVITHTPTNVIQYNEYYPFGLQTSSSWTRVNTNDNQFLYNAGSELNKTTAVYDLPFRNYDAAIGRFLQVDPMAVVDVSATPYAYAGNSPGMFNDPLGLFTDSQFNDMSAFVDYALKHNGGHWNSEEKEPTFFDSNSNQAEYVLNNWSMFGFVTNQEGGSALSGSAITDIVAMATGTKDNGFIEIYGYKRQDFRPPDYPPYTVGLWISVRYLPMSEEYSDFNWIFYENFEGSKRQAGIDTDPNNLVNEGPYYYGDDHYQKESIGILASAPPVGDVDYTGELTLYGKRNNEFVEIGTVTFGFTFLNGNLALKKERIEYIKQNR